MDARTIDVTIYVPKGEANAYRWDEGEHVVRFAGTSRGQVSSPFEQGSVAETLDIDGEPMTALVAISLPTFRGCRIEARVIGALEILTEFPRTLIVAAAQNDERLKAVQTWEDLAEAERQMVQQSFNEGARWRETDEVLKITAHARERARMSRVGQKGTVARLPAWQVSMPYGAAPEFLREGTPFSWAEYALSTLPTRFQAYVRTCLSTQERILLWVYRPLLKRGGFGMLARETLRAGVAILTDQQFLWVVDPVTPGLDIEGYGYAARTFALERFMGARLEPDGEQQKLTLQIRNGQGHVESFSILFPVDSARELGVLKRRLHAFLPAPNDRRLARRVQPEPVKGPVEDPLSTDRVQTRALLERLQAQVQRELGGDVIFGQGFVPEWAEGGARILTVAESAVLLTPDPQAKSRGGRGVRIPLEAIGTVELCNSPLGSWFRVWLPTEANLQKWEMDFPLGTAVSFQRCFVALRQLLAAGTACAEREI